MMIFRIKTSLLFVAMFLFIQSSFASKTDSARVLTLKDKTGAFSFYWGYNRALYGKTNLHFSGPHFDFTVYDVVGTDRPSEIGWVYVNPGTISIPQYNYRIGYNVTDRVTLSVGLDHMKYVITQGQTANVSGIITKEASEKYAGNYLNQPFLLSEDFLRFEHSDGFNLVSFDVEYSLPLFTFYTNRFKLNAMAGLGGIFIVAKTKVAVMNYGLDNNWHLSGYTLCAKTGLKLEYRNRWFALAALRGGYSSLHDVLVHNESPERADHNLSYLEGYAAIGVYFRCWKPRN